MRRHDPRLTHRRPELSQHFLRDAAVAHAIVRRARCSPGDLVVEPGAGDGLLTTALADAGLRVIAVEKDARLYDRLRERFAARPEVQPLHADFLDYPLPATPYHVVANVPYAITAALVRRLLHSARPPDEALLIVQREAAEKFAGVPRETQFSLLHKPRFEIEIAAAIPQRSFIPPPRVSSALLRITARPAPLIARRSRAAYETFIRETFTHGAAEISRALRRHLTSRQVRRLAQDLAFAPTTHTANLTFNQWLSIFRFVEHECLGHDPTRPHVSVVASYGAGRLYG